MSWIVVYTKPRQEVRAKGHLENLCLEVLLPLRPIEKIKNGTISVSFESLFPRYILVRNDSPVFQKVSHLLRNVRGVSQIVKFGGTFAELDDRTVEEILKYETALSSSPLKVYEQGDDVIFTHGAFKDIQAVYEQPDGDKRVILLFDLLNKRVRFSVPATALKRG